MYVQLRLSKLLVLNEFRSKHLLLFQSCKLSSNPMCAKRKRNLNVRSRVCKILRGISAILSNNESDHLSEFEILVCALWSNLKHANANSLPCRNVLMITKVIYLLWKHINNAQTDSAQDKSKYLNS